MVLDFLILFCQLVILAFQIIQLRNQIRLYDMLGVPYFDIKYELNQILSKIIKKFKQD